MLKVEGMAKPVREVFYYQRRQIPYRTYSEGKWTRNSASIMELVEQVEDGLFHVGLCLGYF